ncbi:class I SAM-dependent methyltransferase [Paenibacillus sp. UNC451MF]|uniref:class I SAM-dependent methyltransferase n=1 Tax=Paenibacillus sp. UNC451MF TaxID=1449063 RepID=UPI00048F4E7E|nr:class I SAM-dependent methyltransferase [Paenibacillus sp. UNC451MF]
MPLNFHDRNNRSMYTGRTADLGWQQLIEREVNIKGVRAADIGCGGGIYTEALAKLGAASVVGIDFSSAMLEGAAASVHRSEVTFQQGNALETGLADEAVDLILERALIHHLTESELKDCFHEANRILSKEGTLIVQDRTPEDCLLEGNKEHLRGYLFEQYPQLKEKETGRRHAAERVIQILNQSGFREIEEFPLWEIRQHYDTFTAYRDDLQHRTGRSILHELTDEELNRLTDYIQKQTGFQDNDPVVEKDRWTIWIAKKH